MQKDLINLTDGKICILNIAIRVSMIIFFMLLSLTSGLAKNDYPSSETDITAATEATEMQQGTITGTVTDQSGSPIIGATVVVKGTAIGANTDASGRFSLTRVPMNSILEFSFIGMTAQEIPYKGQPTISVIMEQSTLTLDDVVVIGYGTVKKPDVTGAVAVAPVKDMAQAVAVASFAEALAGRIAGVKVSAMDGQPGGDININIRGISSLTQSTAPLFVVDGFPVENLDPTTLNQEEIESMTILKDASSTAIYGSRGANGVILIQTKRGKVGKPVVSFSTSMGFQMTPEPMKLMSPYEYIKYQQELDPALRTTTAFFAGGKTLEDYRGVVGANFQDYVLRTGTLENYNLAVRGGNDQTRYSISGTLFDQLGVIINTGLTRYSGRVTLDQSISENINAGVTANYSGVTQYGQVINQGAVTSSNPTAFVLARAWMYQPIVPDESVDLVNDEFEDWSIVGNSDYRVNPVTDLENQHQYYKTKLFEANGYISFDLTKELTFKTTAGIRHNTYIVERFYNSKTSQGSLTSPGNVNGINGSVSNNFSASYSNENTLTYRKVFNSYHSITGLALFSLNGINSVTNGYSGRLLPNENLGIDGIEEGTAYNPVSNSSRNTMASYAGRFDYSYRSKYILTLTFRADGSSKFVEHWGYFPGLALAWNMHREEFFANSLPFVSTSKLRMSYGSNGNNRVSDFATYARLLQSIDGYSFNNSTPTGSIYISTVANPLLRWEKVNTIDLGWELGLFKDKIKMELDLYRKNTLDLLLNSTLPPTTGFGSAVKNIGKLRNDGLEITVNAVVLSTKDFGWDANFNISFNRNKIMELTRGQQALPTTAAYVSQFGKPLYLAEIGKPAGMMIGYIWEGNYQYSDFNEVSPGVYVLKPEVPSNGAVRNTIQPGDIRYRDINGDGTMTDADITYIGRGQPIHIGGFSNNFSYKGFTLNMFFQWSYGNNIYNANRLLLEGNSNGFHLINQFASYANRWSPDNQTNANYRTRGQGPIGFHSSRVVEDGSFLRFKTLTLNYALPVNLIKKLYLSELSLNVSAQNLATWTKYSGMDPEVSTRNNVLSPGYDYSSYPKSPAIVFGLRGAF
jgi:TonB-linked SusC/RagA family outer membrane protein